jgi:hypothetical protein
MFQASHVILLVEKLGNWRRALDCIALWELTHKKNGTWPKSQDVYVSKMNSGNCINYIIV